MTSTTSPLLRRIAGQRLVATSLPPWPSEPLDERSWSRLTAEISNQRIWTSLADVIARGLMPATDAQAEQAFDQDEAAVLACLQLDRTLRDVWDQFAEAQIDARVFKGASSAMLLYPEPRLRTYSDVDLLVSSAQFGAATAVLGRMGGRRHNPDPRSGYTAALGKSAGFTLEGGWEIDLHRSPQGGPFGASVPTQELFESSTPIVVGGRTILALSVTHLFLTACYHAILPRDHRRLVPLLDIAQALSSGITDTDDVIATARRWRGTAVVAAAVEQACRLFAVDDDVPLRAWADAVRPPLIERRWLHACTSNHPRSALVVGAYTAAAYPSRIDGIRYLGAQLFHDARQPVPVRLRKLGQRLAAPGRSEVAPRTIADAGVVRPRLGFVGFHSDGTGRDPLSQSELVAEAFASEQHIVRCTSTKRPPVARLLDQITSVLRWKRRVDVVFIDVFSGRSFVSAELAAYATRSVGVPCVLVLHGGNLPTWIEQHPRRVEMLCRQAVRIVAPSDYLADAFRGHGYDVRVVPNLVRSPVEVPRARSRVDPTILWMRTFERVYQPDLAVRSLRRVINTIPSARMTMAGADRGELGSTVDLADALGIRDAIDFVGFVGGDEKARLFERHDIFLNTTSIDNTPVTVLEAAAAGLPVVATRVGGIGVLLRDGTTGLLVDDGDVGGLAGAVERLCTDPDLVSSLSEAGQDLAADFAWPRAREGWQHLLGDIGLPTRPTVPESGVACPLALADLPRVAEIHLAAFSDSQLSVLGAKAVERYYRWQFLGPHQNHARGVWDSGVLIGFVFGGRYRGALQGFLHHNMLPLAWEVVRHPGNLFGTAFRERLRFGASVFTGQHRRPQPGAAVPSALSPDSFGVLAIAVHPAHQGEGTATILLRAAEDAARRGGFDGLHLNVSITNARAVAFYEREGWTRSINSDGSWTGAMRFALDVDQARPLQEQTEA